MSFLFASSHPSEDNRPQEEEEEDEQVQPMQRSGMVRAFSHLPEPGQGRGEPALPRPPAPAYLPSWATEPTETEHKPEAEADPDSHGDSAPPATTGSDTHGNIGPVSPGGATPPAGRSLYLTPRPMPREFALEQAKTYGAGPGKRGNASKAGKAGSFGPVSQPAVTGPSSEIQSAQDLIDKAKKRYNPELATAERTFEAQLDKQQEIRRQGDPARDVLTKHRKNNKSSQGLRMILQGTGYAQDFAKDKLPKPVEAALDIANEYTGLAPAKQIENVDAKVNKTKALVPENWEEAERADVALRQAEQETKKAAKQWNKLKDEHEKKQKQLSGQP